VERRAGANIAWIFDVEGEEGFRTRETNVLDDLTQQSKVLLATGGGSILKLENRRFIGSRGVVVSLETTVEMQIKRTEKDKKRPLLQQGDPREILTRLKAERDPIYQELADIRITLGDSNSRKVVNSIIRKLEQENYIKA
jgi:shikimate kinase